MFSNSDCYTNKDKSKSSTIISQKILTIGKWLETVWTETNVDEFDYFFLTQYPSYSCQKLPWKFFSKKSNRYFAWKFSSIAMLSKEKYCTGMTRRFTVAGFCWAALYGPCCKCCFGRFGSSSHSRLTFAMFYCFTAVRQLWNRLWYKAEIDNLIN